MIKCLNDKKIGCINAIVGRPYYAAYQMIKYWLDNYTGYNYFRYKKNCSEKGSHKINISAFKEYLKKNSISKATRQMYSSKIFSLKDAREVADYTEKEFKKEELSDILDEAGDVVTFIKGLL